MERDDETGLGYHSQRYYCPWLGRWTRPDPIGLQGGMNLWAYASGDPVGRQDRAGTRDGAESYYSEELDSTVTEFEPGPEAQSQVFDSMTTDPETGEEIGVVEVSGGTDAIEHTSFVGPWLQVASSRPIGRFVGPYVLSRATEALAQRLVPQRVQNWLTELPKYSAAGAILEDAGALVGLRTVLPSRGIRSGLGDVSESGRGQLREFISDETGAFLPGTRDGGVVLSRLGGTSPIPRGTNLALGLSDRLDDFATRHGFVDFFTAWDRGYHKLPVGDPAVLRGSFEDLASAFITNGGRLKFNLQGLRPGIEGVTTWELRTVLRSDKFRGKTDFYHGDTLLQGDALKEALRPWH